MDRKNPPMAECDDSVEKRITLEAMLDKNDLCGSCKAKYEAGGYWREACEVFGSDLLHAVTHKGPAVRLPNCSRRVNSMAEMRRIRANHGGAAT